MTLEDDPCDIIGKSMYGQELDISQLSEKTNLSPADIQSALDGSLAPEIITSIANALGLSAPAILSLDSYQNEAQPPDGLYRFTSPYGYLGVNAYLIAHGNTATAFDTGTDALPIIEFAQQHQLKIDHLYITHRHPDHIASLDRFENIETIYPEDLTHGQTFNTGELKLTALDVSGHADVAMAYLYEGLSSPVCICGDSIFAGSMGKAADKNRYLRAIETATENILSLPDNTIICPGHGPLTTVALEKTNNPFFVASRYL